MAAPKLSVTTPESTRPLSPSSTEGELLHVPVELLDENPFQPRGTMDEVALAELAASIAASGLLQPIVVRPSLGGRYQVVAGHRRTAAFRKLAASAQSEEEARRYSRIAAQVRVAMDDAQMAVGAYVENAQRSDLNPVEEAAALLRIKELSGARTPKELCALTGQQERRLRRVLRMNDAPKVLRAAVSDGVLVPAPGEGGEGKERRERRRMELLAALELLRLWEQLAAKQPKAAEERLARLVEKVLLEGWGLRRVQEHVEAALMGRQAGQAGGEGGAESGIPKAPKSALFERGRGRLLVHMERVPQAPEAERQELVAYLEELLTVLRPQATAPGQR